MYDYFSNILDIAITSLLIYVSLLFSKRVKGNLVLIGISVLLIFYILAKTFDLQVTFVLLKLFGGIAVVTLAIVFQSELRRYLELVGLISTRRLKTKKHTSSDEANDEILQACVQMAQAKIGALIVIQGEDNIDQLTEGGVILDGIVSEEILSSIFDPKTAGHDGAVIISQDRILRFGVQLPLSSNFKEIGKHGTRHSAGLGLSERSDATVVVVSEEKGSISIAHNGTLKKLNNYDQLEEVLDKESGGQQTNENKNILVDIFTHNMFYKIVAVGTSIILKIVLVTTK